MPDYTIAFNQASTGAGYKSALVVAAAAAAASGIQIRRGRIFDINIGQSGPPNSIDTSLQWDLSRISSFAGFTTTAAAPNQQDVADPLFMGQCGVNATVEGTVAAQGSGLGLWNMVINQRAAYRWIAKDGKEHVYPATANIGMALRVLVITAGYTGAVAGTVQLTE